LNIRLKLEAEEMVVRTDTSEYETKSRSVSAVF
jgi:hypothetical protein